MDASTTFLQDPLPAVASPRAARLLPHLHVLYYLLWQTRLISRRQSSLRRLEGWLHRRVLERSRSLGGTPDIMEVPRIRADRSTFRLTGRQHYHPLVLEGFLEESPAVRKWSLDYLAEHHGQTEVKVVAPEADGKRRASYLDLGTYVGDIRAGENKYVMGCASFFEANTALLDDFDLPRMQRLIGKRIIRLEAFIGGAASGSSYHCAGIGNLFCQVHGEKRWVLVPPQFSKWMYAEVGKNPYAIHVSSPIRDADYERQREDYPLYAHVPRYVTHLRPGDVLFNPAWWWHEVSNVGETIGVPIRVVTTPRTNPTFLLMALTSFLASKEFLHVIVPITRKVLGLEKRRKEPGSDLFLTDDSPVLDAAIQDFFDRQA